MFRVLPFVNKGRERKKYHQLSREDQVIMVRLRTRHSRLRHHYEIPHRGIRCVPLRYIAHDGGTLPAGL